ncbi:TIGR03643 family protein [Agaribacter flavus]|uniref:TIGR03643 family protein n=1 Tax=Agaribacter flavus TaxID=1902781 RepID=A0ABV7FQQ2_9ALTE
MQKPTKTPTSLNAQDLSRVIEMAWEDRTPFEAIQSLYGLSEPEVIALMRQNIKRKTFNNWRARVSGRKSKHASLRNPKILRGYCSTQYKIKRNA